MILMQYGKMTGRSRGFGFVMSSTEAIEAAAQQFNGYDLMEDFGGIDLTKDPKPLPRVFDDVVESATFTSLKGIRLKMNDILIAHQTVSNIKEGLQHLVH